MQKTNPNKETSDSKDKSENNLFSGDPSQNIILLQELMNLSPDIFFRIDLKGLFEYLSPSAENLLPGAKARWNTVLRNFIGIGLFSIQVFTFSREGQEL